MLKAQVQIVFVCMRSAEEIDAIKNYIANLGQNYVFSVWGQPTVLGARLNNKLFVMSGQT